MAAKHDRPAPTATHPAKHRSRKKSADNKPTKISEFKKFIGYIFKGAMPIA
jgi:hypothetical protein